MTEVDGLALTMLAMIMLSLGVVVMLLACMLRNASKRDQDVDHLLDEMEREEKSGKPAKAGTAEEKKQPWEKEGDWWKG